MVNGELLKRNEDAPYGMQCDGEALNANVKAYGVMGIKRIGIIINLYSLKNRLNHTIVNKNEKKS